MLAAHHADAQGDLESANVLAKIACVAYEVL